jgi:phosphoribosylaminoimidazolecarboxamide formyltransferase/IMP cyclohydrolase
VEEYTGFPEIMGGRVKTLHPKIHGGILADQSNAEHLEAIAAQGIAPFDLIVINLYPFAETVAATNNFAECIEQIDIGGPSMMRGAAKNHGSVAVITHPSQYGFKGDLPSQSEPAWRWKFFGPLLNTTPRLQPG